MRCLRDSVKLATAFQPRWTSPLGSCKHSSLSKVPRACCCLASLSHLHLASVSLLTVSPRPIQTVNKNYRSCWRHPFVSGQGCSLGASGRGVYPHKSSFSCTVLSRNQSSSHKPKTSTDSLSPMAEGGKHVEEEIRYPAVDTYGPVTIRGSELEPGKKKKWCTCGLSKKAPWCDGSHKKTGFRSLKWEVPEKPQSIYQICNCKYTKSPPFCDGTHINLREVVLECQKNCPNRPNHEECTKLCTSCGWKVDF